MADENSEANPVRTPHKPNISGPSRSENSRGGQRRNLRDGRDQRGRGGGRGRGQGKSRGIRNERNPSKRGGRGEKGRGEWSRNPVDKRKRNDEEQQSSKRQETENGSAASGQFTAAEIAAESRQPKRKVAVFIGYAGSGYKGMQINTTEKTIEGDLFKAFVAAGAISKANADDPKKSSLVRCARTDKGVHAAGNMISLKLIVEDPDIVKRINDNLPDQIRVWGMERTNGAFSCYQTCDSRWYEYLIPTYAFLPPHPQSFLGKKLVETAGKEGVYESYKSRQEEVANFWDEAEQEYVNPILDRLDPETRAAVIEVIHCSEEDPEHAIKAVKRTTEGSSEALMRGANLFKVELDQNERDGSVPEISPNEIDRLSGDKLSIDTETHEAERTSAVDKEDEQTSRPDNTTDPIKIESEIILPAPSPVDIAVKDIKAAYLKAKKAYRMPDSRRQRVEHTLSAYLGTRNFHNYTIQKNYTDASAKRVIKSFNVGTKPIIINDTEWLSLKVHGQSFMMHQIRKMVAMAALVVRCGSDLKIIEASYGPDNISIPKAPGLGLLLEKPVFDSYNERAVRDLGREKLTFTKFKKEMNEFKQRHIYERIFREEEKEHQFHTFFHHIDHYRSDWFLWVTAAGISASKQSLMKGEQVKEGAEMGMDSEDEADAGGAEEG